MKNSYNSNVVLSQCDRTTALEELFSLVLYSEWPVVALLGSGCSQATAATAELTHFYNITQASSKVCVTQYILSAFCHSSGVA